MLASSCCDSRYYCPGLTSKLAYSMAYNAHDLEQRVNIVQLHPVPTISATPMASQRMSCLFIALIAVTVASAQAQFQAPSPSFFSTPPVVAPSAPVPVVAPPTPTAAIPAAATTPSSTPSVTPSAPKVAPVAAPVAALTTTTAPAPGPASAQNAGATVGISGWTTLVLASGLVVAAVF
ncbi:hypothetical protein AXG93_1630s1310 [Marchantia polymorpha subsp. ruderalis]|uniref:Uncharacterized protein n=3 Tax=Marchantia polymorpha TaxID=3197 RepID=A0A176VTN6_MARPO|nr:hypothetical protein AXG93_1630s1310 [Marchantia polymorpha subsp. ruderalis]